MPPKPPAAAGKGGKRQGGSGGSPTLYYAAGAVALAAVALYFLSGQKERIGVCGDGLCGYDEDMSSCAKDCKGSCGDAFCSRLETCVGTPRNQLKMRTECAADCGHCTTTGLPSCATEGGMDAQHNATMLWGTYRPHLFFGTRTRSSSPVFGGLMWHHPYQPDLMRYDAKDDGISKYGWVEHDGKGFGHQEIVDSRLGVELNTTFVKSGHEDPSGKGGDWTVRVSGKKLSAGGGKGGELTLVFHLATFGKGGGMSGAEVGGGAGGLLAARRGRSAATGAFTFSAFSSKGVTKVSHFSMRTDDKHNNVADHFARNLYKPSEQKGGGEAPVLVTLPDEHHGEGNANAAFLQVILPTPFEVDFVFTNHHAHGLPADPPGDEILGASAGMRGDALSALIAQRREAFGRRFEETFKLKSRACTPSASSPFKRSKAEAKFPACGADGKLTAHAEALGRAALSQMMGGMSYLHGTWFKATPPFYNNSVEQSSVVSFSATPCRAGFARGFLWDEGFHQMLIARWEPSITRDALLHWFDLMQPDGWIPREHFIGGEARRHIEARWWTQNPTHANPPTLLLALEALMDAGEAPSDFLRCLQPKIAVWVDWFRRTQKGHALYSFRWSGRVVTEGISHTLSSGLDDYPRSNMTSTLRDRHVDMLSWVATMLRIMDKIEKALDQKPSPPSGYGAGWEALVKHAEAIHWDRESNMYADRGLQFYPTGKQEEGFVEHYGYVSLFPFLLSMVPKGNHSEAVISIMADDTHLRSKAGLRSLSKSSPRGGKDPVYGTQEDYWRGKVWICINYLALKALKTVYAEGSDKGKELYDGLRASIVDNMVSQYSRKGYIFEQYDDKTGEGLKHKPFAGWSALVLLIMAEIY